MHKKKKCKSVYQLRKLSSCGLTSNTSVLREIERLKVEEKHGLELAFGKQTIQTNHHDAIGCLAFESSEGRYLLSSSDDGTIAIYDCEEGIPGRGYEEDHEEKSIEPLELTFGEHHNGPVSHVCWYPVDTGMFFSSGADGLVKAWDTNSLVVVRGFDVAAQAHCVDVSGISTTHKLLAVASENNHLRLCDLMSGSSSHTLVGHKGAIYSVQWSNDNEYQLVTASQDNSVRLWDIRRSACVLAFDCHAVATQNIDAAFLNLPQKASNIRPDLVNSHQGAVYGVRFAPDGAHVLSIGADRMIRLWDIVSGTNTNVSFGLRSPSAQRRSKTSFSHDGRYFFVGNDNCVHVHETASGRLVRVLRGHFNEVLCTAVNPKTRDVCSAGLDQSVLLWSYHKWPKQKRARGHRQRQAQLQQLFDDEDSEADDWQDRPSDASESSDSDIGGPVRPNRELEREEELQQRRRRSMYRNGDLPWSR